MTGLELDKWIKQYGFSQDQAATVLGISRQTLLNQRNRASESVSRSLADSAMVYSITKARNDLAASYNHVSDLMNQLCMLTLGEKQ
jgi:predicted DNA-binding protein (UPF0251 family)